MWKRKPIAVHTTVMAKVRYDGHQKGEILNIFDSPPGGRDNSYFYNVKLEDDRIVFLPESDVYKLTEM